MNNAYRPLTKTETAIADFITKEFPAAVALEPMDEYPQRTNDSAMSPRTTADTLEAMAATFRERNAIYGSNYKMVGKLMAILFPAGVSLEVLRSDQFHLFELVVVKLSRLAIADLRHEDSAHDAGVYCAMIETAIKESK